MNALARHHTRPEAAYVWRDGWAPLDATWEVSVLALVDGDMHLDAGEPLFARLNYDEALGVADRYRAELVHEEHWPALEHTALILKPELRAPTADMSSVQWSRSHDAAVWRQLEDRHWDEAQAVLGDGKYWLKGAPPGKSRLMGWDKDGPQPGQSLWQPASVAHNRLHFDYGTTTKLVRRRTS